MRTRQKRAERRDDALSRDRIVQNAIEMLDAGGESALTLRALGTRLSTGSGALYWHIADKETLLAAATHEVVARAISTVDEGSPVETIRMIAAGIFDAIEAHPWVGLQLSLNPIGSGTLDIFEKIGGRLAALGVPEDAQFHSWSALINYILGIAGQNAANARRHTAVTDRTTLLTAVATRWAGLDAAEYPFLRRISAQLATHDDRDQFLAGVDLILDGIATATSRSRTKDVERDGGIA